MAGYFPDPAAGKRRPAIGYGGYFDADPPMIQSDLTPEQREALLQEITGRTGQASGVLFDLIDTPGAYLRGAAIGTPGERASEDDFLNQFGLMPDERSLGGFARPAARFAVGATLDPLNAVSFGGLGVAGKAVKGAGLLDDATRAMSRKLIQNADLGSKYTRNSLDEWATSFGKQVGDLTDADLAARPLAGTRQSYRNLTVGDIISSQPTPAAQQEAAQKIANALSKQSPGTNLNDILGQKLSHDIGFGMPFSDHSRMGMSLPFGENYAKGMDRAMQAIRWSGPGRYAHSLFNQDVSGAVEGAGQVEAMRVNSADRMGEQIGRRLVSEKLQPIAHLIQDKDVATSMRRVLNGVPNATDLQLLAQHPELQTFANEWPTMAQKYLDRRAAVGLPSNPLKDRFGLQYFPRHIDDINFADKLAREGGFSMKGGVFSRKTGDMMARQRSFMAPGGEDVINRLALDPEVAGQARSALDDESAALYIKAQMDAEAQSLYSSGLLPNGAKVPSYRMSDARRLARVLHQRDANAIAQKLPLFGNNFAEDFRRYVVGNERAISVNNTLMDSIAGSAKPKPFNLVEGGNHAPVRQGLKRLGMLTKTDPNLGQIGAAPEVLARIQQRFGAGAVADIKGASLSKDSLRRLTRIADYYATPKAQSDLIQKFDGITRLWKSSILSWPAKFSRDWYGAAFINAVELGDTGAFIKGYSGAKHLVQGDLVALDEILQEVPAYKAMSPKARIAQFQRDMAAGGAVEGTRTMDYGDFFRDAATGRSTVDEMVPGINKETTLGFQFWDAAKLKAPASAENAAYSELTKNWDPKNFFKMGLKNENDVRNPIMRWSSRLGNTTDKINRMSGIIGLMTQGVDPMEAIRRMKAAHVDYGSLTKFEREAMRRAIPFWSFSSRIGKWVADKITEKPGGRFTQLGLRAPDSLLQTEDEGYVPESIRSSYGMPTSMANPVSFLTGQETKPGVTPWLTDIDIPGIDQINMIRPTYTSSGWLDIGGTVMNTAEDHISKLAHPLAKAGFEATTGIDSFTKRPIKEMRTTADQVAEDMLGIPPDSMWGQMIKKAKPAFDIMPFAPRMLQVANRLGDYEKVPSLGDRAYQMGVNAFTGVKFQNVDDEARRVDARKKISDMMMEDPLVRSFTQPFIPEEAKPYVSPDMVQMMALDRQLGRELKKERDAKAGVKATKRKRNTDPMSYFE